MTRAGTDPTDDTPMVCAGLPIELWALVVGVHANDRRAVATLGATCRTLRRVAADVAMARVCRARASMDVVVDVWERASAPWRAMWLAGIDCPYCDAMPEEDRPKTTHITRDDIFDDSVLKTGPVCDACALMNETHLRTEGADADTIGATVQRVDITRQCTWGSPTRGVYRMASHSVRDTDFAVPSRLFGSINDAAAARLSALLSDPVATTVYPPSFVQSDDATVSVPPTVRSWLPMGRAVVTSDSTYKSLLVCCDSSHPLWGAIALVYAGGILGSTDLILCYSCAATLVADYVERDAVWMNVDILSWVLQTIYDADDTTLQIIP
ncbi:hypothetical protein pkur_cds_852 [Pandoravirus kuranda]|uniref:Uncharacterized protein n=1 Tax=Pandoravirus kuranda TaxID=3019033 RepID=A0AA95ENU7_9VIRU|nr:hypothetical protein pkur_cds_852 [Pandoravirus kuranda]